MGKKEIRIPIDEIQGGRGPEIFSPFGEPSELAIQAILEYVGEDPDREGLKDTPARVLKAWKELCIGYTQDPGKILSRDFDGGRYNQMIACCWIEFHSICEHHLLPFSGYAHLAYVPAKGKGARVVGLSKLARLVECFARRLQIQEQMTMQIADALEVHLRPRGSAVVIQAKHLCMSCRGVQKHSAVMVTNSMRGVFMKEGPARQELMNTIELSKKT